MMMRAVWIARVRRDDARRVVSHDATWPAIESWGCRASAETVVATSRRAVTSAPSGRRSNRKGCAPAQHGDHDPDAVDR